MRCCKSVAERLARCAELVPACSQGFGRTLTLRRNATQYDFRLFAAAGSQRRRWLRGAASPFTKFAAKQDCALARHVRPGETWGASRYFVAVQPGGPVGDRMSYGS